MHQTTIIIYKKNPQINANTHMEMNEKVLRSPAKK